MVDVVIDMRTSLDALVEPVRSEATGIDAYRESLTSTITRTL